MHFNFLGLAFLSLLTLALGHPLSLRSSVATEFPDPNDDPFYKAPSKLSSYKLGQVIRSRAVNTTISNYVNSSFQVLFRTNDTLGNPEATVATIWKPTKPKSPPQILSYHSYMDSDSLDCDPSWAFVAGSASQNTAVTSLDAPIFIEWALSQGIYVVDPDDEGPKAAFIAGYQQGQAALDGIRATKNFYKLPNKTEIALTGYSGGASVTVWAESLAASYAPDLNIIGAVHGGTPVDLRGIYNFLNGGFFSGFAGAGLVGVMNAYPSMNKYILDHVNASSAALIAAYRGRNDCLGTVVSSNVFTNFTKLINVTDPLDQPPIKGILARESLLMNVSPTSVSVPTFPRLLWHALEDEIVPFSDAQEYVTQQCQHGANIQFQIFPVAEHISAEILGIPGAILFLDQIFTKSTPSVICGTSLSTSLSLLDPAATKVLSQSTINSLKRLNGTKIFGETINLYGK